MEALKIALVLLGIVAAYGLFAAAVIALIDAIKG